MWKANKERGTSLVETLMAVFIAVISMTSLGAVIFLSTVQNKNEGFETTRMTVFAREKIEELIYLDYSDTSTNISSVSDAAGCKTQPVGRKLRRSPKTRQAELRGHGRRAGVQPVTAHGDQALGNRKGRNNPEDNHHDEQFDHRESAHPN